jgi:hypothetical protein
VWGSLVNDLYRITKLTPRSSHPQSSDSSPTPLKAHDDAPHSGRGQLQSPLHFVPRAPPPTPHPLPTDYFSIKSQYIFPEITGMRWLRVVQEIFRSLLIGVSYGFACARRNGLCQVEYGDYHKVIPCFALASVVSVNNETIA